MIKYILIDAECARHSRTFGDLSLTFSIGRSTCYFAGASLVFNSIVFETAGAICPRVANRRFMKSSGGQYHQLSVQLGLGDPTGIYHFVVNASLYYLSLFNGQSRAVSRAIHPRDRARVPRCSSNSGCK